MSGKDLIDYICSQLILDDILCTDSNIITYLRNMTMQELNQ